MKVKALAHQGNLKLARRAHANKTSDGGSAGKSPLKLIGAYKKPILAVGAIVVLAAAGFMGLQIREQGIKEQQQKAYLSGSQAYSKGNFEDAIMRLEQAKKLNPGDAKARVNLAQSYEATGKLDKAVQEYKASLQANPNQPEARYNLGIIYKSQGKLDAAIQELNQSVKLDKGFVAARIVLGDLYVQKGATDKAKAHYQAVMDMKPFGVDLKTLEHKLKALK